jgi:hypothetical protein
MNTYRTNAVVAGILLLVAWIPGVAAAGLTSPLLGGPDYLSRIAGSQNSMIIAICLLSVMNMACPGIAMALYPVLKRSHPGLAIGSVGFRSLEGALLFAGLACMAALLPLSREFLQAGTDSTTLQTIANLLRSTGDWFSNVAALLAFHVGAFMYYFILYRTKLVPRWLSAWGMFADVLGIASAALVLTGAATGFDVLQTALNLPIGLQELVLAGWLIVKGFDRAGLAVQQSL